MLGDVSRVVGVQSYSERPKKSSSLDLIDALTRARAHESVESKDLAAVIRIAPPRCDELTNTRHTLALVGREEAILYKPNVCQSTFKFVASDLEVF